MSATSRAKSSVVRAGSPSYFRPVQLTHSVSQFTLLASTKKGTRPDFHGAMGGDRARELYHYFLAQVQQGYDADRVKNGVFQAMMVCWEMVLWHEICGLILEADM